MFGSLTHISKSTSNPKYLSLLSASTALGGQLRDLLGWWRLVALGVPRKRQTAFLVSSNGRVFMRAAQPVCSHFILSGSCVYDRPRGWQAPSVATLGGTGGSLEPRCSCFPFRSLVSLSNPVSQFPRVAPRRHRPRKSPHQRPSTSPDATPRTPPTAPGLPSRTGRPSTSPRCCGASFGPLMSTSPTSKLSELM